MAGASRNTGTVSRPVLVNWSARYISLPFVDGGRSFDGVDCWGLVRLIYATELNIQLESYGDISARNLIAVARNITNGKDGEEWTEVHKSDIEPYDAVVMRFPGSSRIGHCGIITENRKLLHIEHGKNAVIVSLSHISVRERIACFRRHKLKTRF